jgi:hypothetical protein
MRRELAGLALWMPHVQSSIDGQVQRMPHSMISRRRLASSSGQ